MKNIKKLIATMTAAALIAIAPATVEAKTGWNTTKAGTYYEYANGKKANGLTTIGSKTYWFSGGYIKTGWQNDNYGVKIRYFHKPDGHMATGFVKGSDGYRYFNKSTGKLVRGWAKTNGKYRYFTQKTGLMLTGWNTSAAGKRYFSKSTGYMYTGWTHVAKGSLYFDPATGIQYVSRTAYISGKLYKFDKSGYAKLVK